MNYEQAMQYIHSIMRFGSKLGLERMRELMRRLDDPQKKTKFVHVAGTNGKGSTVTMLAEILQASGFCVGKYTSPYVFLRAALKKSSASKLLPPSFCRRYSSMARFTSATVL